jgi:hypothetical protein
LGRSQLIDTAYSAIHDTPAFFSHKPSTITTETLTNPPSSRQLGQHCTIKQSTIQLPYMAPASYTFPHLTTYRTPTTLSNTNNYDERRKYNCGITTRRTKITNTTNYGYNDFGPSRLHPELGWCYYCFDEGPASSCGGG